MTEAENKVEKALDRVAHFVRDEALQAVSVHGADYNSAHEAYAVLAEEVDEFWDWVKQKRAQRSKRAMVEELVQIAAVASKYAAQILREMDERDFLRVDGASGNLVLPPGSK